MYYNIMLSYSIIKTHGSELHDFGISGMYGGMRDVKEKEEKERTLCMC